MSDNPSISIFRLKAEQIDSACEVATRAFEDDQLMAYVFPKTEQRRLCLQRAFRSLIYHSFLYGEVYTTSTVEGIACWLPPDKTDLTLWQMLRSGMLTAPLTFPWISLRRYLSVFWAVNKIHQQLMHQQPHWYLLLLAVDPIAQKKGIGQQLIEPVLKKAAQEKAACYLETQKLSNVAWYHKRGFETVNTLDIAATNLKMWSMVKY